MHVAQYGMRRFDTRPVRSFSHLSASGVAAASAFTIIHRRFTRNRNRTRLIFRLFEYRSLFSIVIGKFGGEGNFAAYFPFTPAFASIIDFWSFECSVHSRYWLSNMVDVFECLNNVGISRNTLIIRTYIEISIVSNW